LGLGVAIGIISITIAPSVPIIVVQIVLGIGFYSGISYNRFKKTPKTWDTLCETCLFTRSVECPGMAPLVVWRK
jgi:predicted membrane chloride channel (bestrophin family)